MVSLNGESVGRVARTSLACVSLLFATGACARGKAAPPAKPPKPDLSKAVVTVKEMNASFAKMDGIVRKIAKIEGPASASLVQDSDKPATREQVLAYMDRLFELARPKFKYTPNLIQFDPKMLTVPPSSPARKTLDKLVPWQCVGKVGPLAAGKAPVLTLKEFGDAVGYFSARIADLTHMPSNRWSPYIKERPLGDDGPPPAK